MKFNRRILPGFALGFLLFSSQSFSQDVAKNVAVAAQVCVANACGDIDPATGLIIMALAQIAVELGKDDPFGKNNDLVKAINTMLNDLKHGPGPNNDLLKILTNINNDLRCGPGPSNDVVKFLNQIGIKITVTGC
ncbi:hypothetical protein [Bradyrhizobium septentrionale]|uniref:Secreted protein n=1 Tax=Bradyrhizobium septentrionale TaxID=1404411 RepID=A0ABZ2P4H6_9BRAD